MNRLLPYALSVHQLARQYPRTVLTAASIVLTHAVAVVWTDVPSEAILSALSVLLGA